MWRSGLCPLVFLRGAEHWGKAENSQYQEDFINIKPFFKIENQHFIKKTQKKKKKEREVKIKNTRKGELFFLQI